MTRRNLGPHTISIGGGIIMLVELYRHWQFGNDIELVVLGIGGFFVWLGGYLADRKAAIEGGGFIVDSIVKLGGVFRLGRRSTDAKVIVPPDKDAP